jgi:hypothetical protein
MSFYKFKRNDIFHNRIKTYPQVNFFIYTGSVYYNNAMRQAGENVTNAGMVPTGYISLYELNIDRVGPLISGTMTKDSNLTAFKSISTASFMTASYGDTLSFPYPLSASISSYYYPETAIGRSGSTTVFDITGSLVSVGAGSYFDSIRTPLRNYSVLSPYYAFSSSLSGGWDKGKQEVRLLSVPSIFYGSSIHKGSVSLKFLITGTVAQELTDYYRDGVLRVSGTNLVGGVVLYNEGLIFITGSWEIDSANIDPYLGGSDIPPKWTYFGATGSNVVSSSFDIAFSGTNYIPTLTMLANAPKGELNQSNNPTFIEYGQSGSMIAYTGSNAYKETKNISIKNITKCSLTGSSVLAPFKKVTFIDKVGIYDKDRNLIGIAKLATPIRKRETDDFTFKLKLDF